MSKHLGPRAKITVRIPPDLHKRVVAEAKKRGISVNKLATVYFDLAASTSEPIRKLDAK